MKMNIQSMQDLKKEMLSVARGERKAPADAARISIESLETAIRLPPRTRSEQSGADSIHTKK